MCTRLAGGRSCEDQARSIGETPRAPLGDLAARLDARRDLRGEVGSLLSTSPAEMVIDMAGVRFLDAGWSGVVAQLHHRVVHQGGGTMRISAVSPIAHRVLDLCGLTSLGGLELSRPPAT